MEDEHEHGEGWFSEDLLGCFLGEKLTSGLVFAPMEASFQLKYQILGDIGSIQLDSLLPYLAFSFSFSLEGGGAQNLHGSSSWI